MGRCFNGFFNVFAKLRWLILLAWVAGIAVSGYYALSFLDLTNVLFTPPVSSDASKAHDAFRRLFADSATQTRFVVLLRSESDAITNLRATNWTRHASDIIQRAAWAFPDDPKLVVDVVGYYTWPANMTEDDEIAQLFLDRGFMSPENRSSIILITTSVGAVPSSFKFVKYMRSTLDGIDTANGTFSLTFAGADTLSYDMNSGCQKDLMTMDAFALPLALIVLVLVVRSITMMFIPIVSVATSTVVSFAVMVPIAKVINVPNYCPAIMMSIIVAMSIDYSLFILTRFSEEIGKGRSPRDAVKLTLRYSGATVLMSGTVLTVCLLSMAAFPLGLIVSTGISAAISLLCTMITSLSFIPTILLIGGKFFAIPGVLPCFKSCRDLKVPSPEEAVAKETKQFWFRYTSITTRLPWSFVVIFVVLLFLTPFCLGLYKFKTNVGLTQILPRNSITSEAMKVFAKEWPVGELFPFNVIVEPREENVTIMSDEFFELMHNFALSVNETGGFEYNNILSIATLGGVPLEYSDADALLNLIKEFAYTYLFNTLTNKNRTATTITLASTINPNDDVRVPVNLLRPIIANYSNSSRFNFYLTNQHVDINDSVKAVLDFFPYVVGITAIVISVMVAILFQSFLLPLRVVFTIALTLTWTYGVASALFCTNWFWWLNSTIKEEPNICWVVPVMSFSMLVGLGLDYDIFLFTRINEYRRRGWDCRSAIIKGVAKTGHIITFAGIIMAIAFSGLAFSHMMVIDQFSVVLTLSVLLDTFIIRTSLNPALIYLMGPLTYFPRCPTIKYTDPTVYYPEAELESDELGERRSLLSDTPPSATGSLPIQQP